MKKGISRVFLEKNETLSKDDKNPLNCQRKVQGFDKIYT